MSGMLEEFISSEMGKAHSAPAPVAAEHLIDVPEMAQTKRPAVPEKTLRDEFAMAALQGLVRYDEPSQPVPVWMAGRAYAIADAMLADREAK